MNKKLLLRAASAALLFSTILFFGCGEQTSHVSLGNVVILGDSYSTFEGHIPADFPSWYSEDADYSNVRDVKQTWWYRLIKRTNPTCY